MRRASLIRAVAIGVGFAFFFGCARLARAGVAWNSANRFVKIVEHDEPTSFGRSQGLLPVDTLQFLDTAFALNPFDSGSATPGTTQGVSQHSVFGAATLDAVGHAYPGTPRPPGNLYTHWYFVESFCEATFTLSSPETYTLTRRLPSYPISTAFFPTVQLLRPGSGVTFAGAPLTIQNFPVVNAGTLSAGTWTIRVDGTSTDLVQSYYNLSFELTPEPGAAAVLATTCAISMCGRRRRSCLSAPG